MIKIKNKKKFEIAKNRTKKSGHSGIKRFIFWFVFLCFLGILFWLLFFSKFTQVDSIEIVFDDPTKEDIEKILREELAGKYFGFLPKNNIFFLPQKRIERRIEQSELLLAVFRIKRIFPQKISVFAKKREGVFIWQSGEKSFLVDDSGKTFRLLSGDQQVKFSNVFPVVIDKSSRPIEIGQEVVSDELAAFFNELTVKIEEASGLKFKREIMVPSLVAEEVSIEPQEGEWRLFLSTSQSVDRQAAALKALLEKKLSKSDLQELEYIDLRIKGRILYKIKSKDKEEQTNEKTEE
jgi:cell division septal protein FtsQ